MVWIQMGGSDPGCGRAAVEEAWSHFGEHLLHCSLKRRKQRMSLIVEIYNTWVFVSIYNVRVFTRRR